MSQTFVVPVTRLVVKDGAQVPITFLLGFAAAGLVTFLSVAVWTSPLDDPTPRMTSSLVLGAAAALAAGLIGGFVAEVVARRILWPSFGWSLLTAPVLALQLLQDSDHVVSGSGSV